MPLRTLRSWAVRVYLFRHGRMRAADRFRTGDILLGKQVLYLLSYIRMEPARRIELRLRPYQRRVLPLPLGRHESRYPGSNRAVRRTKAEPRAARIGMASGLGFEPAGADFRGRWGHRRHTRAPCTGAGLEPANDEVWLVRFPRLRYPRVRRLRIGTEIAQG